MMGINPIAVTQRAVPVRVRMRFKSFPRNISNHLDCKRGPKHLSSIVTGELIRQERQRDGGQTCAKQCDDLGAEQARINGDS